VIHERGWLIFAWQMIPPDKEIRNNAKACERDGEMEGWKGECEWVCEIYRRVQGQ
jgi:hypothetical protein